MYYKFLWRKHKLFSIVGRSRGRLPRHQRVRDDAQRVPQRPLRQHTGQLPLWLLRGLQAQLRQQAVHRSVVVFHLLHPLKDIWEGVWSWCDWCLEMHCCINLLYSDDECAEVEFQKGFAELFVEVCKYACSLCPGRYSIRFIINVSSFVGCF